MKIRKTSVYRLSELVHNNEVIGDVINYTERTKGVYVEMFDVLLVNTCSISRKVYNQILKSDKKQFLKNLETALDNAITH